MSQTIAMLLHKSVVHDSRVRREAAALVAAGYRVTVLELSPAGPPLDGFSRRSVLPPAWVRGVVPFHAYRLVFLGAFVRAIVRARPDVVHAHDAAMLLPGLIGARLTGARLVYDSHELATGVPYRSGAWERFVGWIERVAVPHADAVITVTDGIADRLQSLYGLPERPTVVRNSCDLPRPGDGGEPGGLRARIGLGRNTPLVLHQGAAAPGRGGGTLVRAMGDVPLAHLVFLGTGFAGFDDELRGLAQAEGIGDRVHFVPSVSLEALLAHTREADVGVTLLEDSCENHRLALPNKLFEYLAAGVPVVASDLPELRRIVEGRGVGWTVDSSDPRAVGAALSKALREGGEPELRSRIQNADDELSWRQESSGLVGLYAGDALRTITRR